MSKREKPEIGLEKILKTVIFIGTLLILFTPLILHSKFFFPFVGPKSLYFMGLTEIIFFSWFFLMIFHPKYRPRLNFVLLSLALFTVILIVASLMGVDPEYSFWSKFERMTGILMMLHLLAFFVVVSSVFKEKDWLKFFSVSIFVGTTLSIMALFSKDATMRGGATIGNDSFLGTYLIFDLFLALYLILKSKNSPLRIYSLFCFLIMAVQLLMSGARAAKLSFLGGLILLLFLWMAFNLKGKIKIIGRAALILLAVFVIVFGIFALQPESFARKNIIERMVGETFGGRFVVWQGAWKGFLEKPVFGWGLENFEYSFSKHYDPCLGTQRCGSDVWYDRAHNIIFDTLVTSGIIGFLSYLLIFTGVFWILWKQYRNKNIDFWTTGIFSAILISYSIQNLTVFDMVSSYMIFYLTMGFISFISPTMYKQKVSEEGLLQPGAAEKTAFYQNNRSKNGLWKQLLGVTLLILLIVSIFEFVIKPLEADFYVIKALQTTDSKERIVLYKKTLDFSATGKYQMTEQLADNILSLRDQVKTSGDLEGYKTELDFMAEELEKSLADSPLNLRGYLKLGQIYNTYALIDSEKLSRSEMVLKQALEISPKNQQVYWELIQTKLYQGDVKEALVLAEEALSFELQRSQSYLVAVQVAKIAGNDELAQKRAEEAIKVDPALEPRIKQILEIE